MLEIDILLKKQNFVMSMNEVFSSGITGIYGPSGSGKTSMLHAIAGLLTPEKGRISISGTTLFDSSRSFKLPVEQRSIGYVFQEGRLFPHMSVKNNLKYGIKKKEDFITDFEEIVDLLQLSDLLDRKPHQISGGERQRTAIGRSLLSSPKILLLDEPFSALDSRLREQIIPFIQKIHKARNIPVLVVSHELPDLLKLSSQLCVIKDGECLGNGLYYDLLQEEKTASILYGGNLVNTLEMKISGDDRESGMYSFESITEGKAVQIKATAPGGLLEDKDHFKIFIHANDIALSTRLIENISIQNQIEGKVIDFMEYGPVMFCLVDAGFRLIVEITKESKELMDLKRGQKVYCLFKSMAVQIIA